MRTVLNSSVDPLVGRLLDGRYKISGRLAQGGMAVVYTAFDTRLDRPVAVKVMHPALAADEDFVARFRREAKAAARLSNPHVVAVTDQGRDGEVVFLVMELVEGRTLRELLREEGRLHAPRALEILIQVLEALAAAHQGGLVHRDIKPENVLVADDGTVKVTDFGLARAVDASPLTATTGLLMGTVAYLAPEQVARGVADARADVYACGVMLFELLAGRPPFEGANALQVAYQHLHDVVPAPSSVQPDVPPAVDRLVADATARDPADRPHDATALLFRTRAVLGRLDPAPATPRTHQHDTAPIGLELAEASALELARRGRRASSAPVLPAADPEDSETADEPTQAVKTRRRLRLRPSLIAVLLLILATVAAGLIGWRLAGRTVAIPAVIGTSPPAASAALRNAHLSPHLVAEEVYSETVPKGKIAVVQPEVGHHASRGAAVTLKMSLGPERYTVPTVTNLSLVDASSALRVAHLRPGTKSDVYSDTVPAGAIVSSDPQPGVQAKPNTPVALVVSRGAAPVTAPAVAAMPPATAQAALQKLGLKVTSTSDFSETVAMGRVIALAPTTGLHRGQSVSLSVSKGPQLIRVPSVENASPGRAKQLLTSLGLNVVTRSFPGLDSSILTVRPGAGSLVRLGSQIIIYLY